MCISVLSCLTLVLVVQSSADSGVLYYDNLSSLFTSGVCTPLPFKYCNSIQCSGTCIFNGTLSLSDTNSTQVQSLTLIGESYSSAIVQLSVSAPIPVASSAILNLTRLQIRNASLLGSTNGLQLQGIDLRASTSQLIIQNCSVYLDCSSWLALQNLACYGYAPGMLQASNISLFTAYMSAGGTIWQSVTFPIPQSCNDSGGNNVNASAFCSFLTLPFPDTTNTENNATIMGEALLSAINSANYAAGQLQGLSSSAHILLNSSAFLLPSKAGLPTIQIMCNLTISGPATLALKPELDMNLMNFEIMGPSAFLTLRNLVLVNKPTVPSLYPVGLLTMLPNDPGLTASLGAASTSLSLVCDNITIVVPDDELEYLQAWFGYKGADQSDYVNASWALQPQGPFQSFPGLYPLCSGSTSGMLCIESMRGFPSSWEYLHVDVVGSQFPIRSSRKIYLAGLQPSSYLLMPWENSLLDLPLSEVTAVANNNVTVLGDLLTSQTPESVNGVLITNATFPSSHFIVTETVNFGVVLGNAVGPLMSPAVIVGDPVDPMRVVIDMSGPKGDLVIAHGPGSSPLARLYIRNVILNNLMPAQPGPGVRAHATVFLYGNYTSMLWTFNTLRNTSVGTQQAYAGGPGTVILSQVTMVLPAIELQVYRNMLAGVPSPVNPTAQAFLTSLLQSSLTSQPQVLGENVDLQYLTSVCPANSFTCNDTTSLPGDIFFPQLIWLGLSGTNVTWTAKAPPAYNATWPKYSVPPYSVLTVNPVSGIPPSSPVILQPAPSGPSLVALPPPPNNNNGLLPSTTPATSGNKGLHLSSPPTLMNQLPSSETFGRTAQSNTSSGTSENMGLVIGLVVGLVGVAVLASLSAVILMVRARRHQGNSSEEGKHGDDVSPKQKLAPLSRILKALPCLHQKNVLNAECSSLAASFMLKSNLNAGAAEVKLVLYDEEGGGEMSEVVKSPSEVTASRSGTVYSSMVRVSHAQSEQGVDHGSADVDCVNHSSSKTNTMALSAEMLPEEQTKIEASGNTNPSYMQLNTPEQYSLRQGLLQQMDELREKLKGSDSVWEVTEELGKGGYGAVYKGHWRGIPVAIKRVIFQVMADEKGEKRRLATMQEAALNETLVHPNLVLTYASEMQPLGDVNAPRRGLLDWQMHIIMEYCEGGSLKDAISANRFFDNNLNRPMLCQVLELLMQDDALPYAGASLPHTAGRMLCHVLELLLMQIAKGCAYIHSKNIIHGDLKPDNVLLKNMPGSTSDAADCKDVMSPSSPFLFQAKIADFGLSKSMHASNTHVSGVRQGTPLYMAPEIMRDGRSSKAADVYSFGVMMWELFHGSTAYSQYVKVAREDVLAADMSPPAHFPIDGRIMTLQQKLYRYQQLSAGSGDHCSEASALYALLGTACTRDDASARPSFSLVLSSLENIQSSILAAWISNTSTSALSSPASVLARLMHSSHHLQLLQPPAVLHDVSPVRLPSPQLPVQAAQLHCSSCTLMSAWAAHQQVLEPDPLEDLEDLTTVEEVGNQQMDLPVMAPTRLGAARPAGPLFSLPQHGQQGPVRYSHDLQLSTAASLPPAGGPHPKDDEPPLIPPIDLAEASCIYLLEPDPDDSLP
ncbi:hypothetical protein CEUSTIGMA_g5312.t1 [Chlamydomonas eustigma]|uniref:Protein kinase domain-containing protein n=1 Tax=Chlamydomonas eustigma TaxID=1157962 RepID=A0A250X534_9CHLO|nr:hypothetical protein CEUSTIGMA_g5312.t1 [Chlamydomonas eustigma]|eukprot:GAX77870.1 hypothetical protein CEUSTIGMA_g5312.t1 [Chlamydomonas eustigma]